MALGTAILVTCPRSASGQVPDTAFKRVLEIEVGDHAGAGFTIEVDGRQYLVTAKHLVASLAAEDAIKLRTDEGWKKTNVRIYRCEGSIDIAVLIPEYQLTASSPSVELTTAGIRFGQDAYFLGFPYDEFYSPGGKFNDGHPLPFVKRGIFSGFVPEANGSVMYLDGYNNPGFSGGPIVYRDVTRDDFVFKVAGVVTGFFPDLQAVMKPVPINPQDDLAQVEPWRIVTLKDGKKYRLEDTQKMVKTNTGIVVGYNIIFALELVKKHPDGPAIAQSWPKP